MAETPVLRFPISGQEDESFLVEVSSNGSRPLDLKLIGSESTAVYLIKLRHKRIDDYRASPGHCTDEEWEQTLTSIFVDLNPIPDVEVRADVQSDGSAVTLSFRKNIQGITQRLGSIKLEENEKTEISPFDWCVSAIASREKVTAELAAAKAKVEALEQSVKELTAQLDDFIVSKEEDETQMLEKFRDLLNEKKLKIRQQQRLLAAATVDPKKLANIAGAEDGVHRDAGPSRRGKRKTSVKEEDESDDGFERMDVDKKPDDDDATEEDADLRDSDIDEDQQVSTEQDVTASEPDEDGDDESDGGRDKELPTIAQVRKKKGISVSPPRSDNNTKGKAKGKAKPQASRSKQSASAGPSRQTRSSTQQNKDSNDGNESEDDAPPPPRALPFMRSKKAPPPAPKPAGDDDETASDEDSEL